MINVHKGEHDGREFRYVRLENDLKVLLVSEGPGSSEQGPAPAEEKPLTNSAACMFVSVGGLQDPENPLSQDEPKKKIDGMAHFCEHMLFLGTEKYPEENRYQTFLQQNGGDSNAATGEEYTYFYFNVNNKKFNDALDIFSQFFKAPLFNESAMEREINAIENEFKMNLTSEEVATDQLEKSHVARPGSIVNRFLIGNKESLQVENILEELKKFYKQNYSSHKMNLALCGHHSLDELEKMAQDNFGDVKHLQDGSAPLPDYSQEVIYDRQNSFARIFKVATPTNIKQVSLIWQMPPRDRQQNWKSKSAEYLTHVLGHEGPDSLFSHLSRLGLATWISSGSALKLNKSVEMLAVDIGPTEKGEQDLMFLIEQVYMFINRIKQEGVQDYVFEEFQYKSKIDYRNYSHGDAESTAISLARRLRSIKDDQEVADIMRAPFVYESLDKEDITRRLDSLHPENMYVIHHSMTHKDTKDANPEAFQKEKWFQRDFTMQELTADDIQRLTDAKFADGVAIGHPPRNTFMPRNLQLKKKELPAGQKPSRPQLVLDSSNLSLFFKQDDQFEQPFIEMRCKLFTTDCGFPGSTQGLIFSMMWVNMLNDSQREMQYMGGLAGIKSQIAPRGDHILITFDSYNDQVENFVAEFFKNLQNFECNEAKYQTIRDQQFSIFLNSLYQEPYARMNKFLQCGLVSGDPNAMSYIQILDELSFEKFMEMKKRWLQNVSFQWLIQGHLTEEDAKKITYNAKQSLDHKPLDKDQLKSAIKGMIKLPDKAVFDYMEMNPRTEDSVNPNSAIMSYFQLGEYTYEKSAILTVLFTLLNEPCFQQLRNKEQLGYVVQASFNSQLKVLGGQILIQSGDHGPDFLESRINEFLKEFMQENNGNPFTEEQVEAAKKQQMNSLQLKALDLATETQENWIYIQGNYLHSDQDGKITVTDVTDTLINSYRGITCSQVNAAARELFITNPRRINLKLCSQNHKEKKEPDSGSGGDQIVERPADDEEDDPEECLATPKIKEENVKAREQNKRHYEQIGLKSEKITDIEEFRNQMSERYPFEVVEKVQDDDSRIKVDLYMADDQSQKAEKDEDKKDEAKEQPKTEEKKEAEKKPEDEKIEPYAADVADVEQDMIEKEMLKKQQSKVAKLEAKIDALLESNPAPKTSKTDVDDKQEEAAEQSPVVKNDDVPQESCLAGLGNEVDDQESVQESVRDIQIIKEQDNRTQKIKDGKKIEEKIQELMAKYKNRLGYDPKPKDKADADMQECPQGCGLFVKAADMEYHCCIQCKLFKIECENCEFVCYPNDPQSADFYAHNCIEELKKKLKEANDEIVALSMGFGKRVAPQRNVQRAPPQVNRVPEALFDDGEAEAIQDDGEVEAPRRNVADADIPPIRCREGCQMQLVSGIPAEYENVGVPRCDECTQTSLNEYENFYHCATCGFDLCKVCAFIQANLIRRDQDGKFPMIGQPCPLTYEPNGRRHENGQMCDGGEIMVEQGMQINGHPALGNCLSSPDYNITNKNQQYFYCEAQDVDVCVCCARMLQQ